MIKEVVPDFQDLVNALDPSLSSVEALRVQPKMETIFAEKEYWSLHEGNRPLVPLTFSNGKTQEDVVREVIELIKKGAKLVFIHGVCGTGKSAIALNIARKLGRTSIVVPVKALQKQYEDDYTSRKYLIKSNGQKLNMAVITGRDNHDSIFMDGANCADQKLPETIKINEKNFSLLREYYYQNPFIRSKNEPSLKDFKRISIAPANPYWSPIVPAQKDLGLKDAQKKKYRGLQGQDFIFYHRKHGCSYYDQFQAYLDADVLMFNSAKYKIETRLNRKPSTEVEIIDEADEFLDNFSQQETLNLTRLGNTLGMLNSESEETRMSIDSLKDILKLEEKNKLALGIREEDIFKLDETHLAKALDLLLHNPELEDEAYLDEASYIRHALEVAINFAEFLDQTYVTYKRYEGDLYASLVTTNLAQQCGDMIAKNKALVFMSGTLHSRKVLKEIFGITDFAEVEAETILPGTLEIVRTGKEFDCKYASFYEKKHTREEYLRALDACVTQAKRPILVHVNAYEDLPSFEENVRYGLKHLMPREQLRALQEEDKHGKRVGEFKNKKTDVLFSTKCSRGADFPGETCNSIIFTKFPNPNPREIFWRVLERTHKQHFWDFYKDKARREFLQRLYRALRSRDDHVYVLSPDLRVLNAVQDLQKEMP